MEELLATASYIEHNKSELLFQSGQIPTHLYLITKGWVKISRQDEQGDEGVLQLLSTDQTLLESAVIDHKPYAANAHTLGQTKLIAFPIETFRSVMATEQRLLHNLLQIMAHQARDAMNHLEQLSLKNSQQRVGWFILKLLRHAEDKKLPLRLPCDKSLIASYLGMKPETFSRTLQNLKQSGIELYKKSLIIHDLAALCDYCNLDLMHLCSHKNTTQCPKCEYA